VTHEHSANPAATPLLGKPDRITQDPTTKEWVVWWKQPGFVTYPIASFKFAEDAELFVNIKLATQRLTA
jgi:hypothetical protein